MEKAVLISIRPEWCQKIIDGEKSIEVRKTRPKLKTPFKCFIYCTLPRKYFSVGGGLAFSSDDLYRSASGKVKYGDSLELMIYDGCTADNFLNGKVIGEFICDTFVADKTYGHDEMFNMAACMSEDAASAYSAGSPLYGWHISDLKIYDTPKPLSDFKGMCKYMARDCCACPYYDYNIMDCKGRAVHPPQSWCYVEYLH